MAVQKVYVVARGEEPLAAPTDIAKLRLDQEPTILSVSQPEWNKDALTMVVDVEANTAHDAVAVAGSALTKGGMDLWRRFAVSATPLTITPQRY